MRPFSKLLPKRPFALTFAVLVATSAAASLTGFLTLDAWRALSASLGGGPNVLVLSSGTSKLPQTGIVPLSLADKVGNLSGVQVVSPEALAPVAVGGRVAFLRGVIVEALQLLDEPTLLAGAWFSPSNASAVAVGSRLAKLLGTRVGDEITLRGLLVNKSVTVSVAAIFETGGALDDEIVAPLYLGQSLRGLHSGAASLIRMKVDPSRFDPRSLESAVGAPPRKPARAAAERGELLPTAALLTLGKSYVAGNPVKAVEKLVERSVAISEALFLGLVLMVLATSSLAVYHAVAWTLGEVSDVVSLLRHLGATRTEILFALAVQLCALAIAAGLAGCAVGYLVASTLSEGGLLRVAFHTIVPALDLGALALSLAAPAVISLVSLLLASRSLFEAAP